MIGEPVAVALLTCVRDSDQRFRYLERTISSFLEHNPFHDRFVLIHGDDFSSDARVLPLVQAAGFRTVLQTSRPKGWLASRTALINKAARVANWVLFLEDDIEWLAPFPWRLFDHVARSRKVDCLRLYGEFKDAAGTDRCLAHNKSTGRDVHWRPVKHAPEPAESAHVHWSAQPSVTRAEALRQLHYDGTDLRGYTVRVVENVTSHIGVERTATR